MIQPLERENKPVKPNLKFLYCPHDDRPGIPDFLINEIADRPYIFLEAVSFDQSPEERASLESSFNLCLSSSLDLSDEQIQTRSGYLSYLTNSKVFSHQLVFRLAGSDKKIFLIDADPTWEFFPLFEQVSHLRNQIFDHLIHDRFDLAGSAHQKYIDLIADLHLKREQLVYNQILFFLQELETVDPAPRVAIIQGRVHSPTASLFTDGKNETESHIHPDRLPPEPALWLKKRLGEPISDHEYLQALIIDFLLEREKVPAPVHHGLMEYSYKSLMSLIQEFDLLYRQHLTWITNRRRLSEEAKEPYRIFIYHSAVQSLLRSLDLRFH